jgi:hypothetical protein
LFASPNASPYVKDGFDGYLVHDRQNAVNPLQTGTKAAPQYQLSVKAGSSETIRLRLSRSTPVAYAAWDLAFHVLPLAIVDHDFAKAQLDLMLRNDYLHPNGQIPAYEWNFGDVNPPVHAYATMQIYQMDKEGNDGKGDIEFLKYAFAKLLVNFTWWVNRKDRSGDRVSIGGSVGWNVFDQKRTELVSIRTDDFNGDISGTQFRDINSFPFMATAHCYIGATDGTHVYFGGRAGVYYVKQRLEIGTVAFDVDGWQFGVAPEVGLIAPLGYSTRFIANVQYNLPFSSGTFLGGESRSWQSIGFNVGVAFGGH